MNLTFDSYEEWLSLHSSVHDGILYWKKQLQNCQGKIQLYVEPHETHYSEDYCREKMYENAINLKNIEDATHPDYDYDGNAIITEGVECYSSIIIRTLDIRDRN